ncbi:MAG: DUF3419 family protein [Gammaproteobacteria bacterium]|nr:DUF3419 family protein [Gammaproteobacteria bacterium]
METHSQNSRAPGIRYGQCWEDADVLMEGLAVRPGHACLSIGSAGDNTLALLSRGPSRVVVVDYDPAQIACLELRVAAFRALEYAQVLELLGAAPSDRRLALYAVCRSALPSDARNFWDRHQQDIASGIVNAGRLEKYFTLFRRYILPLAHPSGRVRRLLEPSSCVAGRRRFFSRHWDTWRWRALFRLFFSRWNMASIGRDASCFRFVQRDPGGYLLRRAEHALTVQDPSSNPYLRWILTGHYGRILPYAWRFEHFEAIRAHLDRITIRCVPLSRVLRELDEGSIDRFNLSDVFEYLDPVESRRIMERLAAVARPGARIAYWNLFVERQRPPELAHCIRPLPGLAQRLHARDKTFFYSRFILEEVACH